MSRKLDTSNASQFKRALGRMTAGGGDNAPLFGLGARMRYREIPLVQVEPDPTQPRRNARETDIPALAASIEQKGLLQPINVREVAPDHFVIVAGERRYWAFRQLGRDAIPALIVDTDDPQALALLENVQRVDLHALELAASLSKLIKEKGLVQQQAAVLIGKSQEYVARLTGILRLPAFILEDAPNHPQVSTSLLMELAELNDENAQRALWQQAKAGLTVKAVRAVKRQRAAGPAAVSPTLRTLRRAVEALRDLRSEGAVLSGDDRAELRSLHSALGDMLGD